MACAVQHPIRIVCLTALLNTVVNVPHLLFKCVLLCRNTGAALIFVCECQNASKRCRMAQRIIWEKIKNWDTVEVVGLCSNCSVIRVGGKNRIWEIRCAVIAFIHMLIAISFYHLRHLVLRKNKRVRNPETIWSLADYYRAIKHLLLRKKEPFVETF